MRPQLLASHSALDAYTDQLSIYALALVDAEAKRRTLPLTAMRTQQAKLTTTASQQARTP